MASPGSLVRHLSTRRHNALPGQERTVSSSHAHRCDTSRPLAVPPAGGEGRKREDGMRMCVELRYCVSFNALTGALRVVMTITPCSPRGPYLAMAGAPLTTWMCVMSAES